MPVFRLYFEKRFDLTVEAELSEVAQAAGKQAIDDGDIDDEWFDTGEWELVMCTATDRNEHQQGIRDGRIVHTDDV